VLINFDALPARVFHEVDRFVSSSMLKNVGSNKKSATKKRKSDAKD
jgi:hypothetical protein